ncbi:MAG: hypothetical protein HPY64_05230 [Anaerolineae bacterium]|nr:hypothetical protein [Anaerolineae bacterium]
MDSLLLFTGPIMVSTAAGAWVALGRLYAARLGGIRLAGWIPWAILALSLTISLVLAGAQLISAALAVGVTSTLAIERGAAAIIALLISPVWLISTALAVLGITLHYALDPLLGRLGLAPVISEGLARGLRAAWAVIGLLALLFGLQSAYEGAILLYRNTIDAVLAAAGPGRLIANTVTILVGLLGMSLPPLVERDRRRAGRSAPPADGSHPA